MEFRVVITVRIVLIASFLTGLSGKPFPAVNEGRSLQFEGDKTYNLDKSVLAKLLNNKHISTANYRNIFKITIPLNAHTHQDTQKTYRDVKLSKNAEIPKSYIRQNLIPLLKHFDYINHAFKSETSSQQRWSELKHTASDLGRLHARFQSNKNKRGENHEQPDEKQETVIPATFPSFIRTTSNKNSKKEAGFNTVDHKSSYGPSNAVPLLLEGSANNSERDVSRVIQGSYPTHNKNFQGSVTRNNRYSQLNTRSYQTETTTRSYEEYTTSSSRHSEHSFDGTGDSSFRNNRSNDTSGDSNSTRDGSIFSSRKTKFTVQSLKNEACETKSRDKQIENGRSQESTKLEDEGGLGVFITGQEYDHTESFNFLGSISTSSKRLFDRNGLSAFKNKGDSPKPRPFLLSNMNISKLLPMDTTSQATTEESMVDESVDSFHSTTTPYQTLKLSEERDANSEGDTLVEEPQATTDSAITKFDRNESDCSNYVEKTTENSKCTLEKCMTNGPEHIFTSEIKGRVSSPTLEQIWNMSTSYEISQPVEILSGYSNLLLASNKR